MTFRHLKAMDADWVYPSRNFGSSSSHDWTTARIAWEVIRCRRRRVAEFDAQKRRAEVERFRSELREPNARAREKAMEPPTTCDRAHVSQTVRPRSTRLACGMKTGADYAVRSWMYEVNRFRTPYALNWHHPTLRRSIVRERWRARWSGHYRSVGKDCRRRGWAE
jgi:hypothetical protein